MLGEFPRGDDDTVIAQELITEAISRDVEPTPFGPTVWGVDVARFGSDSSALCKRKGNAITEPIRLWRNLDTMQLTGAVKAEYDSTDEKPMEIFVDSIGLGAGVKIGCVSWDFQLTGSMSLKVLRWAPNT